MPTPKLKFNGQEIELGDEIVTAGRAPDNTVAFSGDSNVSRYHVEIERRGPDYWIIELGSSNGTTVNGERLTGERPLAPGDRILLGGSSEIEFVTDEAGEAQAAPAGGASGTAVEFGGTGEAARAVDALASDAAYAAAGQMQAGIAGEAAAVSSGSYILPAAGVVGGLAVVCVVAAGAFFLTSGSACDARAAILKPEPGDTIGNPVEIVVEAENTGCVSRAVFTIDGLEFASAEKEPYSVTIDPAEHPDLADGLDHGLSVVLVDEDGQQMAPTAPVMLAFETREVAKPSPSPGTTIPGGDKQTPTPRTAAVSLVEMQQMATNLVKQFRGGFTYNVSNKQFLQEVQKRTAEYAQEGYFDRAAVYRDAINVAYVREQNLDAPLGFMLAMSRSKFNPARQGDGEGLWQMSTAFVTANAYNGSCGSETLSDASQNCAAKASALYMKAIVWGVFDGDAIYSAAAFGKSPQDAGTWKASLPQNRTDLWNVIRTPQEREQLVRFFAAGIVAENPQKFGLKRDRPLSELYRVVM